MPNCDPKALVPLASCMQCVPRGLIPEAELALLVSFTGYMGTASDLSKVSAGYGVIQNHLTRAAMVYLMASHSGFSTDPKVIASQTACFASCVPPDSVKNLELYLWDLNAGNGLTAAAIAAATKPFLGLGSQIPRTMLWLLDNLDGTNNPQATAAGAACIAGCLTDDQIEAALLYFLCQGLGANLIPPGSTYTGSTPEFDIAITANTYYRITWGANDVSATVCGNTYPSTGAKNQTVFYSGSCTLLQLFGNAAGTSVTAILVAVHNVAATVSGFTLAYNPDGTVKASWDTPPSGASLTEVWTSTDDVTYALAASVAAPGTSTNLSAPGAAQILYAKARWFYPALGYALFCKTRSVFGNWAQRVINNGGAQPSQATLNAIQTFVDSLITTSVWGKLITVNVVAPDSLTAARTPLIVGGGNDPWTTTSPPVAGNLSVAGWFSSSGGDERTLQTGLQPQNLFTGLADGGLTIYIADFGGAVSIQAAGCYNAGPTQIFALTANSSANNPPYQAFNCFGFDNSQCLVAHALLTGFLSGNRTSSAIGGSSLYWANSVQAFGALASSTAANTVSPDPALQIVFAGRNQAGVLAQLNTTHHISFCAIHHGLTSAEAQTLFNAVQALRVALGGGFT